MAVRFVPTRRHDTKKDIVNELKEKVLEDKSVRLDKDPVMVERIIEEYKVCSGLPLFDSARERLEKIKEEIEKEKLEESFVGRLI